MNQAVSSTSSPPRHTRNEQVALFKLVGVLMLTFRDRATDTEEIAAVYTEAFATFPFEVIETAIWEFVRGQVPGRNHAFAPSSAEVCARAQEIITEREVRARREVYEQQCREAEARYAAQTADNPEMAGQLARMVREVVKPIRQPWMHHPSWEAITTPPEGGWKAG